MDPQWAGGRPRQISSDDEDFIVATARTRPAKLGRPFTHWSLRKLADYLACDAARTVDVGRERLRQILQARGPLRTFVMGNSNHPNHTVLARELQAYLRWRNANARHPDVLVAQRRERARIRSERQQRWGRPRAA